MPHILQFNNKIEWRSTGFFNSSSSIVTSWPPSRRPPLLFWVDFLPDSVSQAGTDWNWDYLDWISATADNSRDIDLCSHRPNTWILCQWSSTLNYSQHFFKRLASPPQNIGWTNVKKSFKSRVTPLSLIHEWGTHFQHLINRLYRLIFLSNSNMKILFFTFWERFLFLLSSAKTVGVSLEFTSS